MGLARRDRRAHGRAEPLSLVSLGEAGGGGSVHQPPRAQGRSLRGPAAAVAGIALLAAIPLIVVGAGQRPRPAPAERGGSLPVTVTPSPAPVASQPPPAGGPIGGSDFAAGSCVAFLPTAADRHRTVFLDAGHGGPDPGALGHTLAGGAVDEADLTLSVVMAAIPMLQDRGYRVVVSRTTTAAVAVAGPGDLSAGTFTAHGMLRDSTARARCANLAGAAVLISVHFNAGMSAANGGALTIYDDLRAFGARSLHLATLLQGEILGGLNRQGWGIPDGGVVTDGGAGAPAVDAADRAYGRLVLLGPAAPGYLVSPSDMPGAVVEPLFVTNPFEAAIATGTGGREVIATGIARAADAFLSQAG